MNRLTHERVNGIKSGYWSQATKEQLVQRLAAYENTGLEPEEIQNGKGRTSQPDETKLAQKLRTKACLITDIEGLQHEVIHYGDLKQVFYEVTGWMI